MVTALVPVGGITARAADPTVISENTTWNGETLSNDVQIEEGVTVTIEGMITIDGNVTISGSGTIIRGINSAYFSISSGSSLTLDGVTVDGDGLSSSNSMFNVASGTLALKDSTVQNCAKNGNEGGAVNMDGGTLTIENTTIKDCSATQDGGAIYLDNGSTATIKSGTFSGNKTTTVIQYGGGFIYNRGSTLTIEGGSFLNNSSNGRGGAVYNTAVSNTKTYIRGGVFEGNTSSYSDYEGSGAVFYSAVSANDTILYISGGVRFGNDTASGGTDGVYLHTNSSGSTLRKMQISSALQYPVHIYVSCSEGRAIAEGVEDYTLTAADMTRIQFHDVGTSGTSWYAWLDSTNNEVDVSAIEPLYVVYDANGATGSVTDNTIYSSSNNQVTVKSSEGLTYEGHIFTGWNTQADGNGTSYQPGATFEITETTTLYAQWETTSDPSSHSHPICGVADCGHDGHQSIVYTALAADVSGQTLTSGNYSLTDNITDVNTSIQITGTVNLCLNGHEISGSAEDGIFRIGGNGVLNVCDCAGNGKITESGGHNPIFLHSGGTLNLYSGTIESARTAIVIDEDPSSGGTDSTGGTVNVYGGTVSSTGNSYQAIKVNPNMTAAVVNLYDGEVTSSNRGISAESGEINITGGVINAGSYALNIDDSATRVYLSGTPAISGDTAAVNIYAVSSAGNAVLVLHAKGDASNLYTGDSLSTDLINPTADYYIAQGVADGMLTKLSLVDNDDYSLAYDETNDAIQIKERTYTVTLPSGQSGYTVTAAGGSTSPVEKGGGYSFTVTVDSTDKYYETDSFAVKANDITLTPDEDGVYTISNITADQTVTVEGVAQDTTAPTAEIGLGTNKWNTFLNNITFGLFFKNTQTVTISASDSETGVEKTEYYISDTPYATTTELETAVGNDWKTYSASFSIMPNSKNIIYAKVTDKVGNVYYVSSQGIVLYTDAQQVTQSITFAKSGTADVTADVALRGNTIDEIYCETTLLTSGTQYTVNGDTITFKASWLDTLAVGDYTLTVHYNPLGVAYADTPGNSEPATTSIALKVQETTTGVTITNDISKIYDGSPVSDVAYSTPSTGRVEVEYKLREAADSTYTTTKPSAVDEYTVRVTVAADGSYPEASATKDFDIKYLTAPDPACTLSGTEGSNGWYISDVTITPPNGYTISDTLNGQYSDTLAISASDDDVKIYLKNDQEQMTDAISVSEIKIDKDDPSITATGDTDSDQPSDTVSITVSDNTSGVAKVEVKKDNDEFADITASYQNGYTVTENGTYTFRVTDHAGRTAQEALVYDNFDTQKPVVTIEATHGGAAYTSGTWTNQDITLTPKMETQDLGTTTYQYRVSSGAWQDYTTPIVIDTDTDADGTVYEFKAKSASGVESDVASITVKRDTIAPDGDIKIEENSVKTLINSVTFGLFFNENVDVTISESDDLSGVGSVLYYRSEDILTEEQVAALTDTDWTKYTDTISVTAVDAEKFIYYVKVIDNAGNTTCFASNGAAFDLTDPVISGVTDGGIYYTTQTVQVTDDNLDTVTLNGSFAASEITLAGNVETDTKYTIVAMDKVGNTTSITITMKPTTGLSDAVEDIEPGNVSSSDKEVIEDYLEDLNNRLEDENLTDEEKETILGLIDDAQNLLDKIDDAEQAADTDNIQNVQDITPDNVTPEDKEDLEAAKEDIEQALKDYGDNYTEDEKKLLEETLDRIEDSLEVIEKVEATEDAISSLPESADPDDTEAQKQIEAAKDSYDALSDYEKTLISGEALEKLENLLAQLRNYRIIEGNGSTWTKGSSEGLTLVANGAYSKFTGFELDGVTVNTGNYTAKSGSTVITLKPDYLNVLTAEEHTITVLYTDGEATGTFTIAENPAGPAGGDSASPGTSDPSPIALWIVLMLLSGGAILTRGIRRKS